tara:strand:+ start:10924 stop:11139 length:216 start_codon:yes stop_codon:yes gene_type:complete
MYNLLFYYFLIGIIFGFIIEKANEHFNKRYNPDDPSNVNLNLPERLILILSWPIYLMVFLWELIKNLKNSK